MNDNDSDTFSIIADTFSITADKSCFIGKKPKVINIKPKVINREPKKPKTPAALQEDKVSAIPRRKKKTTN